MENSKEIVLNSLNRDIDNIKSKISYCDRDVNNFNVFLRIRLLLSLKKKS